MKKLVLATLLCGSVAQLGGCIIVGDDDGGDPTPPTPPDAMERPDAEPEPIPSAIVVSWTLLGGVPDNEGVQSEVSCPPDSDVVITADPDPAVEGGEFTFMDDCAAGESVPLELAPDVYDVWIDLVAPDGTIIAQSDIEEGVVLDPETLVELPFEFSADRGRLGLTWTILEDGVESTCANVGAADVSLLLTIAGTSEGDDFLFSCEAGQGVTDPLLLEEYVGVVYLLDANEAVLGESEPRPNIFLEYGNHFVDLGNFTFDILN